jgi:outer membrane protein assembly factor BamE (lipoprotein component of BamABCDE complex)
MDKKRLLIGLACIALLAGCVTNQTQPETAATNLTVGQVQKEIRVGMSGAQVAQILGSPNIVSSDENRNEVWVYDKISTQVSRKAHSSGVWLLLVGASDSTSQASQSQNTLTIVIKFDEHKQVRDFSYHSSRF